MALLEQLLQQLSGAPSEQIGRQLGVDQGTAGKAIASALPVILGGMARNSQDEQGAGALTAALDRDHDGSILDDLAGFAAQGNTTAGDGILGHIFGGARPKAETAVQQSSTLNAAQSAKLMAMLAPIVMGYLGKKKRDGGMDGGGFVRELQAESDRHGPDNTSLAGMVGKMLDRDGDGSALDDVLSIGGSLLSKWRS